MNFWRYQVFAQARKKSQAKKAQPPSAKHGKPKAHSATLKPRQSAPGKDFDASSKSGIFVLTKPKKTSVLDFQKLRLPKSPKTQFLPKNSVSNPSKDWVFKDIFSQITRKLTIFFWTRSKFRKIQINFWKTEFLRF